jgi:hypothetical protein
MPDSPVRATSSLSVLCLVALLAASGCGDDDGTGVAPDAATDAPPEAPAADVTPETASETGSETGSEAGVEAGVESGPTSACAPLSGDGAFGALLSGEADFIAYGSPVGTPPPRRARVDVHAYFPEGRRPGKPVYFAMPTRYPRPGISTRGPFLIGADLGIPRSDDFTIIDDLETLVKPALVGPDQGLEGEVQKNFAFATDVGDGARAQMRLCPIGSAPAPVLAGDEPVAVPTLPLWLTPSAPPRPETLAQLKVTAAGVDVPIRVEFARADATGYHVGSGITVTPLAAFPPGAALTVDATGVLDRLGRPFTVSALPAPLITTATITDRTFSTAPPAGAVAGSHTQATKFEPGSLRVGQRLFSAAPPARALIAIGDPGGKQIRVRVGVSCDSGLLISTAALVGQRGESAPLALACGTPVDQVVSAPASGPLWLSVVVEPKRSHPQSLPTPAGSNEVVLDEVAFE